MSWPQAFAIVGSVVAVCAMITSIAYFSNRYENDEPFNDEDDTPNPTLY